jgi:hypothetical protein
MLGACEQFFYGGLFDDATGVHHHDAISDFRDDAQVVSDQ